MEKTVKCEFNEEIATVTLDNPPVNSFTQQLIYDFIATCDELTEMKLRAVIITGAGKTFQAGADINMFLKLKTEADGLALGKMSQDITDHVANLKCPVIGAINGAALGGGTELALACDMRIASSNASFGLPEVRYGVFPGGGGTQRLPRLIGPGRAKMLIFSGKIITAEEALQIGLVDQVVAPDQLMPEAMKMARMIAGQSPAAVKAAKRAISEGMNVSLEDGLMIERKGLGKLVVIGDQIEGAKAFLEKRKPNFVIK